MREQVTSLPESEVGRWETIPAVFTNAATHVALLPSNKIFAYGGSSQDRDEFAHPTMPPGEILDLNHEPYVVRPITREGLAGDLWCGGHTLLASGKLLFAGGTSFYPALPDPLFGGLRQAYLFDPWSERWERLPDMAEGRWYPTLIRLPDHRVLCIAGLRYRDPADPPEGSLLKALWRLLFSIGEEIVSRQEVFDSGSGQWEFMEPEWKAALYPRLHLLPDGDVFYSGVFNTHYFVPGRYPSAVWRAGAGEWTEVGGQHHVKNREEGLSVMLALRPPGYEARFLVAGGGAHNLARNLMAVLHGAGLDSWARHLHHFAHVENSAELIDLSEEEPRWQPAAAMHHPRVHANGVLLPTGEVAVIGGLHGYGHMPGMDMTPYAVLEAELYDPATGAWRLLAAQARPRLYHSTAILLPDARVISMGSNPYAKHIEPAIEIFSPPYLFRGPRPVIRQCPRQIRCGQSFALRVDAARRVGQVVLMRPEVLTHVTNTDQRLLELTFARQGGEWLEVAGPPTAGLMPPGYCLLFVISREGTPSVGRWVRVGS